MAGAYFGPDLGYPSFGSRSVGSQSGRTWLAAPRIGPLADTPLIQGPQPIYNVTHVSGNKFDLSIRNLYTLKATGYNGFGVGLVLVTPDGIVPNDKVKWELISGKGSGGLDPPEPGYPNTTAIADVRDGQTVLIRLTVDPSVIRLSQGCIEIAAAPGTSWIMQPALGSETDACLA
jgi:hypothetical protein